MKVYVQCKSFKYDEHLCTAHGIYDSVTMKFEDLHLKGCEFSVKDDTITAKNDTGEFWLITMMPSNNILKLFGIIQCDEFERNIDRNDDVDVVEYESECTDDEYEF